MREFQGPDAGVEAVRKRKSHLSIRQVAFFISTGGLMRNKVVFFVIAVFLAVMVIEMMRFSCFYIVDPGETGIMITLGSINQTPISPGFGFKLPFISELRRISTKQNTREVLADCFSSDLQHLRLKLKILYRVPEASAIAVVRDYSGDPFDQLIAPRVQEAVKEVTALKTAADIVKTREQIKTAGLLKAQEKIGKFLVVEDLVIEDVTLSKELETAIEAKMVQQQEAEKALFSLQQAETDAKTQIIKAKADAQSITIQGEALQKNPKLVELKMVEKWDGHAPQVVGGGSNILLPMQTQDLSPK
jgi:prohibitin 2